MPELHVVFIDELTVVEESSILNFGRTADIALDESNQYMHRTVGTFFHRDGVWWIANKSKHGPLTLVGSGGRLSRLTPDDVGALTENEGTVRFQAGPSTYELNWALPDGANMMAPSDEGHLDDIDATTQFGVIKINDEQRLLLVALAERRLVDSTAKASDIPSNASVAHRLGWSAKKLDRKLDYLCARLDGEGVRGLRGGKGVEALDRREVLVEHVISGGMIRHSDVELLPVEGA